MLSPSYLNSIADGLYDLYSQLEQDIIADMAKRFMAVGKVNSETEYLAKIFQESGGLQSDINKWLESYDKKSANTLKDLFYEALQKSASKDLARLNSAGLSDSQQQILDATVRKVAHAGIVSGSKKVKEDAENGFIKCFSGVQRVTMTIASSASNQFVQEANRAYMKVASGAFTYQEAIISGVRELAKQGIKTVLYTDSGKPLSYSVESMIRANVMTGINQTATQITLDNCSALDCELVEVDAHLGSRPEHEAWQGKIYSLNPDNKKYPYFYEVCRYGEPDGICGINCRHSFYPYFEGQEPLYSKEELQKMQSKAFEYKYTDRSGNEVSKKMTQYEAEQMQRGFERQIRKAKTEIAALQIVDKNAKETIEARNKLYELQQKQKDFISQTGLKRDYSRESIGAESFQQPKALKPIENNNYGAYSGGIQDKSSEKQDAFAKSYYAEIRNRKSQSDLYKISNNTGFSIEQVKVVREHLFINTHFLEGEIKRFDESAEIALAWQRLEQNKYTQVDILLLNHEYTEALFMNKKNYSYEKAHALANLRFPWYYVIKGWSYDKTYKATRDDARDYL